MSPSTSSADDALLQSRLLGMGDAGSLTWCAVGRSEALWTTRNVAATLRVADRRSEPVLSWRGVALGSGVAWAGLEGDDGVRLRLLMLSMRTPARERLRLGVLSVVGVLHGLRPADGCTSRTCEGTSLSGQENADPLRADHWRGGERQSFP